MANNKQNEKNEIQEWKRFCHECGEKMIMNPKWKHEIITGRKYISKCSYVCPNKKHFWDSHNKFSIDPNSYDYD